ncbi:LytR/AlgR family response regulator transcription factor [Granulicella arctica]|uniref:Two-component system LytT family response regulator n=1 Tax=Granulicella arctica TaxID=940613 RepID=A0A7Y9PJ60_9BACT|nr:LytTR family DNA-binding domain-containing protein [Granulicella arctica]NYF80872.1 two-component system LytT family response regulator [Granulicella arctica]
MKLKVLIADDEPLARERLRFLLSSDEEIEICGECRNGKEVVATLKEKRYDVLFLDIQMPGSSGFEIIEQVGQANMPITVFVTAHNHYAVKAFEVHALDYLTKPVEPERLQSALLCVKERIISQAAMVTQEQLKSVLAVLSETSKREEHPKRLLVHNGTKDSFVSIEDIEWIEAADYYSCLHVGTKKFMLRETIKQLADTLDPRKFVRVHRSAIVNIDHVREILREGRNEGWIALSSGHRLKMSKVGWQNLLAVSRK